MVSTADRERCELLAEFVIETGATVRACAKHFGISKSTVHKDISVKLKYVNARLYAEVKKILDINKAERHIRGGEATRIKYRNRASRR
ncbi:MAG: sporulation transcriptional regulator SpoIIID [Clostridia bacterium]|nr:sporulation transcriptional regulator SpoIIID [Clostridia bacterium]